MIFKVSNFILNYRATTRMMIVVMGLSVFTMQSSAAITCETIFDSGSELSLSFGADAHAKALSSSRLRLLVWNVHKGADSKLPKDFARISSGSDLVLFQESVSDAKFTDPLVAANEQMAWTQAKSFEQRGGSYTGVATGSRAKPVKEEVLKSEVFEPILKTPKTMLISEFKMEGSPEQLLVANVHAINFVTNKSFKVHIDQLIEKIKEHQGPLIVAGDFNTWNRGRLQYLDESLKALGLESVEMPRTGFLILDHIYSRGLKANKVFDLSGVGSSDHMPLMVDFSVP